MSFRALTNHPRPLTPLRGRPFAVLALASSLAALLVGCRGPVTPEERGAELYEYCEQCHGAAGEGNADYRAPDIAGLPGWYVEAQLDKFRVGARGDHPDDVDGLRMRPMSRALANQEEVALVAQHVASLPPQPAPTHIEGDASRGRELYEPCVQCHGERAEGNREMSGPPLAGQADWYLVAQLEKFRTGLRGDDPLDVTGAQMRPMALELPDEQAIRDVVAYIKSMQ